MRLHCICRTYDLEGILRRIVTETHTATLVYHAGHLNEWWIELRPGVTGFESMSVDDLLRPNDLLRPKFAGHGWFANAGTPGTWPELYVLPEEMERLRDYIRLMRPVLELVKGGAK